MKRRLLSLFCLCLLPLAQLGAAGIRPADAAIVRLLEEAAPENE